MTRLLIVGATGLVGSLVLEQASADPRITAIVAPTRRPLPSGPKLINPVVDFAALPEGADWWRVDSVVSALGTTRKATPSRSDYRDIDHGYTLAAARLALRQGATRYALVSAMGAHVTSPFFYPRLKGEVERDVLALGYPSATIVRPGMIGGDRKEFRAGERGIARILDVLAHPAAALSRQPGRADRRSSDRGGGFSQAESSRRRSG